MSNIKKDFNLNGKAKSSNKSWKDVTTAANYFITGEYDKALPLLSKYEGCESRAMLLLACMFFEGIGAIEDMKRGVSYLQKLVEFEDIRPEEDSILSIALFHLGELHFKGFVVKKDDVMAESLWLLGAALRKDPSTGMHHYGSVECQSALAMLYSNPERSDLKSAFYWHKKAQQSGSVVSEGALGVMYFYGIGTEEDERLAYDHLSSACSKGSTYAKGFLASVFYKRRMYHMTVQLGRELANEGNTKNLAKEQGCPEENIKKGISKGCFYFALCCQYGFGIEKDNDFAKELITKAIEMCPEVAYEVHTRAILGTA